MQSLDIQVDEDNYIESNNLDIILNKGLNELANKKPENPIKYLGLYFLNNDPQKNV